jgi:hypothetical protein
VRMIAQVGGFLSSLLKNPAALSTGRQGYTLCN